MAAALKVEPTETIKVTDVVPERRSFRIEIDFLPPSANKLTRNKRGAKGRADLSGYIRFKRHFQTACLFAIKRRLPERTPYRVDIRLNVNRKRDIDNCAKAIMDGLRANGLTPDDRWCDRLTLSRDCTIKGCVIEAEALDG